MKLAIISCIHGNEEALNAVLSDIDAHSVDQIYCLGDLVGYGPYPNEVVARIRALNIPTCQGDWDADVAVGLNPCNHHYPSLLSTRRGQVAHAWTSQVLRPDLRDYLATLPVAMRQGNLCLVHRSPVSQPEHEHLNWEAFVALKRMLSPGAEVLFCGHRHLPSVQELEGDRLWVSLHPSADEPHQFTAPVRRIIHVGSVGEPHHGRPNATYTLYDTDTGQVTCREVPYEYARTCMAILEQGLPPIFAWRLARGMAIAETLDFCTPHLWYN